MHIVLIVGQMFIYCTKLMQVVVEAFEFASKTSEDLNITQNTAESDREELLLPCENISLLVLRINDVLWLFINGDRLLTLAVL